MMTKALHLGLLIASLGTSAFAEPLPVAIKLAGNIQNDPTIVEETSVSTKYIKEFELQKGFCVFTYEVYSRKDRESLDVRVMNQDRRIGKGFHDENLDGLVNYSLYPEWVNGFDIPSRPYKWNEEQKKKGMEKYLSLCSQANALFQ